MKYFIAILGLFIGLIAFGQETIYYDKDGNVCTKDNAEFYRLLTLDENGKPVGKVKVYYISGDLKWEGYLSYCDKNDNSKDICDGHCDWYYKNGIKARESDYSNNILTGKSTSWLEDGRISIERYFINGQDKESLLYYYYDNGNLQSIIHTKDEIKDGDCFYYNENGGLTSQAPFKQGKLHGLMASYDEQEKLQSLKEFAEDEPVDNFWIEFNNDNVEIQKSFIEDFSSDNINHWQTDYSPDHVTSKYIQNEGLLFDNMDYGEYTNTIKLGIDQNRNFSIGIMLDDVEGPADIPYGLVWGYLNWNNYNYFLIGSNGYFKVGFVDNGTRSESGWKKSEHIKPESNILSIHKINDKIIYGINGTEVYTDNSIKLFESQIGIINYSLKTIRLRQLLVYQDFNKNDLSNLILKYQACMPENSEK